MKKTYNLGLLAGGIGLMLTLIASFVLQQHFGQSFLTMNFVFDTFILMAVAFILILQFKSFDSVVAIILVVYGGFNILYGIMGNQALTNLLGSTELEVIFILGLLLGHVLFEVAVLFLLLHVTQPRFDYKFTKVFVIVALSVAFVLLIAVSPLVTLVTVQSVLRMIVTIISIAALYYCIQQMVVERPVETPKMSESDNKQSELRKLYERGIITEEEYKQSIESHKPNN